MSPRRKALIVIAATVVIVVEGVGLRALPLFTGPTLPAGASRLHITTEQPNLNMGCAAALLAPGGLGVAGGELILLSVETGEPIHVVWPAGFGAWQVDGRAVLADPWGSVVGRDGEVLDSLGGGLGLGDDFHVCPFGIVTQP